MEKVTSLLRKEVWLLETADENSKIKDTVLFIGRVPDRHYFSKLFFKNYTHRMIGNYWVWQVLFPDRNIFKNCTFSIIQTTWSLSKLITSKKIFCIPTLVSGSVDLSSDFDLYLKKNKNAHNNLRKVKKSNFAIEISSDPALFDEFYYKMFQPYIYERYGESSLDISYDRLKSQFLDNCEILFVVKESLRIAGTMICYNNSKTVLYELGVRNGDFRWVKQGAISALYFHAINYCRSKGIKKISLGGSRPFFSDGVLTYKMRNWNMKIDDYSRKFYFLFRKHKSSTFAQDFLCKNHFISLKKGKMVVNAFFSKISKKPNSLNYMKTKYAKSGLLKVKAHYLVDGINQNYS